MTKQDSVFCDADPDAISIEDARMRIRELLSQIVETEIIDCHQAISRVTACTVRAVRSVPPFRASAMDGYALRYEDAHRPLLIAGRSTAGHPGDGSVHNGVCYRVTTGAVVPDGADTVVQQENVELRGDQINVKVLPNRGSNIRLPGSDTPENSLLLPAGCELGAAELGLLASHGIHRVEVRRKLRAAVFSTGDELIDAEAAGNSGQIETGKIFDANRPLLKALLSSPAIEVVDLGILRDTLISVEDGLARATSADVVISSGGVSVGEADHVKAVLEQHGTIYLWKIAMKPGRPLTFGLLNDRVPYFGLPGNPVSAALTSLLFVKPALRYLYGLDDDNLPSLHLPLTGSLTKNPGRVEYQRGIISRGSQGAWQVASTGQQDSHVLSSLHRANCLIELPLESSGAAEGEQVKVIPFAHFKSSQLC